MIEKVLIALAVWNVVVMAIYGFDKLLAKTDSYRISEKALFILAALFGAVGAWGGMRLFHHKTRHKSFACIIPILALVNLAIVFFVMYTLDI